MKIVILGDAFFNDSHYQINNFVKYYLKEGFEVTVICSTIDSFFDYYQNIYDKNKSESNLNFGKLKIIRKKYSLNIFFKIRRFGNIKNILNKENPDLIFVQDIHFNLGDAARFKKENPDCKILMNFHADYSNSAKNFISYFVLHRIIRRIYLKKYLKSINKIFPIVEQSRVFLKKIYGIPSHMMELLPVGIDSVLTNKILKSNKRIELRKKYNIANDDLVIFTGGKISPLKQTNKILKTIIEINNPNIFLFIVGKVESSFPDYKIEFDEYVNSSKNIIHVGWKKPNEVYEFMSACDVAVFTASQSVLWQYSIGLGLGLIIGKYITLYNGKIIEQDAEYLNLHNNVIVLDDIKNIEKQIKNSISELYNNKLLLEKMKKGALLTCKEFLDFKLLINQTLNI